MRPYDLAALLLLLLAMVAFFAGTWEVAKSDDVRALYFLVMGASMLWASTHLARSGVRK